MELEKLINERSNILNDNDYHALSFINQNMAYAQRSPVVNVANKANVSASTIIRMTQKLGFNGYGEFRYFLRQEISRAKAANLIHDTYFQTSDLINAVNETIQLFERNTELKTLYDQLKHTKHVFGYATGYGQLLMLKEFSRCLMSSDIYLTIVPGKSEFEMVAQNMHENDLLFVVGLSGQIDNIKKALSTVQLNGTTIVSVTSFSQNDLAALADFNIYYQVSKLNSETKLNETSFSTLNLVLGLVYEGLVNYNHTLEKEKKLEQ